MVTYAPSEASISVSTENEVPPDEEPPEKPAVSLLPWLILGALAITERRKK